MRIRLAKVSEEHLKKCIEAGLWGSNLSRFGKWKQGDHLILEVGDAIAAVAQVSGEAYCATEQVWPGGLFPFRIPVTFEVVTPLTDRPKLIHIKDCLINAWGRSYGWGILVQAVIEGANADKIFGIATRMAKTGLSH